MTPKVLRQQRPKYKYYYFNLFTLFLDFWKHFLLSCFGKYFLVSYITVSNVKNTIITMSKIRISILTALVKSFLLFLFWEMSIVSNHMPSMGCDCCKVAFLLIFLLKFTLLYIYIFFYYFSYCLSIFNQHHFPQSASDSYLVTHNPDRGLE